MFRKHRNTDNNGGSFSSEVEQLYKAHKNLWFSIAFKYLSNSSDAEDAVQEAFARIACKPEKLRSVPEEKRAPYIGVAVRNAAIDILKKEKRETEKYAQEFYSAEHCLPEDTVIGKDSAEELINYIMSMPSGKKDAMFLKIQYGCSCREISEILGISEEAARKRLSDASKMIREFLDGGENKKG